MRARRKRHLDDRLKKVCDVLVVREDGFYSLPEEERKNILDFGALFPLKNPVSLEIGCGKGRFANGFATKYPDKNLIAVEKISNVIIDACVATQNLGLTNLKYLNCSAENLLYFLPQKVFEKLYLNFSCPYPKNAHEERRLTSPRLLEIYKKLLTDGGEICLKTDSLPFFEYSLESLTASGYEITAKTYDLHNSEYVTDNIVTEYEQKFVDLNKKIAYLRAKL